MGIVNFLFDRGRRPENAVIDRLAKEITKDVIDTLNTSGYDPLDPVEWINALNSQSKSLADRIKAVAVERDLGSWKLSRLLSAIEIELIVDLIPKPVTRAFMKSVREEALS